jgi:uncharacterized membrane protein
VPQWLAIGTQVVVVALESMATLLIAFGSIEAFIGAVRALASPVGTPQRREVWIRYARWLIAGLTFLVAADILKTMIHTDWQSIGQLGAIAAIRTFLNFFLERDLQAHQRHTTVPTHKA